MILNKPITIVAPPGAPTVLDFPRTTIDRVVPSYNQKCVWAVAITRADEWATAKQMPLCVVHFVSVVSNSSSIIALDVPSMLCQEPTAVRRSGLRRPSINIRQGALLDYPVVHHIIKHIFQITTGARTGTATD
jgi:hypothetical protein